MSTSGKYRPVIDTDEISGKWHWFNFIRTDYTDTRFSIGIHMKTGELAMSEGVTLFEIESAIGQIRAYIGSELRQIQIRIATNTNERKAQSK